ncbi:MAG TPA: single-stranded-DNA-specific exonuclease RecJ [Terriglobia bacterium]|nr:single-stranded-DNA-specific exonuclease RecJ [Terriglobia bacterium]
MRWAIQTADHAPVARLVRELEVPPVVARLLVERQLDDPDAARRFLHPTLDQLHDPFLMAGMAAAVERVRRAIAQREKILIYGDYDVDGTMAVVVLFTALRRCGALVEAHIPDRFAEGYGMQTAVVERAAHDGYKLVLSVDTGIRAHAVIGRAHELGVETIVTDHHLPEGSLPPAVAVLNPHRRDCLYPNKDLSGVGVAFKLAQALLGMPAAGGAASYRLLQSFLKIVAIGTIADVVPLVGENRVIARFGLDGLRRPSAPGLQALLEVSGLAAEAVTAGDVGFRLAPRLNAAGRMENARDVVDLFMATEAESARGIAERLDGLNRERQLVEDQILKEVITRIEGAPPEGAEAPGARGRTMRLPRPVETGRYSLVLAGEGWHRGVIGIVAQRVAERYHRPALVIGVEGGTGVGSGRSIAGFHLLEALDQGRDLFERYGGHAQAAGFTLPAERIPELERRFEDHARAVLQPQDLEPVLRVDSEVSLGELDLGVYEALRQLGPHGMGNPAPVFAARGVCLMGPPHILKERHLKLRVTQAPTKSGQGRRSFEAIGWGWAAHGAGLVPGQTLDLAFALDENTYQGTSSLQLVLKDIVGAGL